MQVVMFCTILRHGVLRGADERLRNGEAFVVTSFLVFAYREEIVAGWRGTGALEHTLGMEFTRPMSA